MVLGILIVLFTIKSIHNLLLKPLFNLGILNKLAILFINDNQIINCGLFSLVKFIIWFGIISIPATVYCPTIPIDFILLILLNLQFYSF